MRFIILRKADAATEAGVLPDPALLDAMGKFHQEMAEAGILRAGEGLRPSADGVRVQFKHGKAQVIDGPFTESKELIAGFSMIEVESREEALAWVRRWPALDANGGVELELREVGCSNGLCGVAATDATRARNPRFMLILQSDANTEASIDPGAERLAAMAQRNQEALDAGMLFGGDGLQPSARGAKLKFSGGRPQVIDGPYAEAKELIAGYWLLQVPSRQHAIDWVLRYPYPRDKDDEYYVEIRKLYEAEDFGEAFSPEAREAEARMRVQIAQAKLP